MRELREKWNVKESVVKKIEEDALERYQERFEEYGLNPKSLGWGSSDDQLTRFKVLDNLVEFEGKTIMDVGCGFADFYQYLNKTGVECDYIGVDIIDDFIDYCKEEYPSLRFYNKNFFLDATDLPDVDGVVCQGMLNYNLSEISNYNYSKCFIEMAYRKVREFVAVDFLSTYRTEDYPKEEFVFYHDPGEMLEFSLNLSNDVALKHDYAPIPQKEFTILIHRNGTHV